MRPPAVTGAGSSKRSRRCILPNYRLLQKSLHRIGEPRIVTANFSQYSSRYDAYLKGQVTNVFDPAFDGGALRDLGVYNLHFVTGLFGMPEKTFICAQHGDNQVDLGKQSFCSGRRCMRF